MNTPDNLKYAASHEWARLEADGSVTIGITDHAQEALGDLVYLELPKAGRKVKAGEAVAVVESVKAASDVLIPIDGEVIAVNDAAVDSPESLNDDPYGTWLVRLRMTNPSQVDALMDAAAYEAYNATREH